jgi:hypothetical protein
MVASWYSRNKETELSRVRQWMKDHPERVKATKARYRAKHREEINRKKREAYAKAKIEREQAVLSQSQQARLRQKERHAA